MKKLFPWLPSSTNTAPTRVAAKVIPAAKTAIKQPEQGISMPNTPTPQTETTQGGNRLQRWLTGAAKEVGLPKEFTTPEATCLRICADANETYKPFTWDSMSYLLTQLPTIERIEFVGDADVLSLIPDLPTLVTKLKQFYPHINVLVCSTGEALLSPTGLALLASPLDELRILVEAHQLTAFKAFTGKTPAQFLALKESIYRYMTHRKHLGQRALISVISVSYVLNNHNYERAVPEMLREAEHFGVDLVHFSNQLSTKQWQAPLADEASTWFEGITQYNPNVLGYFNTFPAENYRVAIQWPTVWHSSVDNFSDEEDCEGEGLALGSSVKEAEEFIGTCRFPFETVSINLAFKATGCPRWQVGTVAEWHPVWKGDFWHNAHFKQLRNVHKTEASSLFKGEEAIVTPLGFEACQRCPNRCIAPAQTQVAPVNQHLLGL